MTRIFEDGAEFGDILFWDIGSPVASTTQKRSGNYSYYGANETSTKNISAEAEFYFRFCQYQPTNGSGYVVSWYNGATRLGAIYLASTIYKWQGYVSTSAVVTGTNSMLINQWQMGEVYVKIADSGGKITLKIDGIQEFDFTGDTKPGAATNVDNLVFAYPNISGGRYFDDLAFNNTSGTVDNSWCGDGHFELLVANGNGDVNDWNGSDGNKVDNYLLVDDIPSDGDTTFVSATGTAQDMYNVSSYTGTNKDIRRIWAECRAKDNAVSGGTIKIGYKHSGTVYLCSSARALSGNYARVVGDDALSAPTGSAVWSEADLNAIQFVTEFTT
jgi:hypothetical protein